MQTSISTFDRESGRNTSRRGNNPQSPVNSEGHRAKEVVNQMYEDGFEQRNPKRLSFVTAQQDEAISTAPIGRSSSGSSRLHPLPIRTSSMNKDRTNGQLRESGGHMNNGELSPGLSRAAATETATTSFKVDDADYESNPAAVAQELHNLAALRRMSMDVGSVDPDLPSFGSAFNMPSIAPSSSADEDDTSRLFWVPARLHPGIAPKEFKTFLESKADQIKRRSGELTFLDALPGGQPGSGELRRKKSMLSTQVDSSSIGTRSDSVRSAPASSLRTLAEEASSGALSNHFADDKPILPPAPPGHSLRRSTRTTYRKHSLKAGERGSRRFPRQSEPNSDASARRSPPLSDGMPILGLTRVSTDPTPVSDGAAESPVLTSPVSGGGSDTNTRSRPERPSLGLRTTSTAQIQVSASPNSPTPRSILKTSQPSHPDSRQDDFTNASRQHFIPERKSSHDPPPTLPPQMPLPPEPMANKSRKSSIKQGKEFSSTSNDNVSSSSNVKNGLPIARPIAEDKKAEKKSKEKKDSESSRKSSWPWLRSEDKEKDKKKDEETKKHKSKPSKSGDKMHDNTRLDVLQTSIDGGRGRESLVLDRSEVKISDDDRRKDKKSESIDHKKEKEAGLFSSIFGSKRKGSHDNHKRHARHISPDPILRELKPDIDYNWTRFSLLQERAIYRMAHIKLANPRRALYSQVLLSNFMYSYLAKVQQMHPNMSLPTSPAQNQQRKKELQQQQQQQQQSADDYSQYQVYQQDDDNYGENSSYTDDDRMYYDMEGNGRNNQNPDCGGAWGSGQAPHATSNNNDSIHDDDMW